MAGQSHPCLWKAHCTAEHGSTKKARSEKQLRRDSPGNYMIFRDPLHPAIWGMVWETRQFTHGEAAACPTCWPAQPAVLPAAVRQWPSADAWGGCGEESKPDSRYPPAPAPPCDVIPAVFLSDSPWWLFLLWPPPLTSWPKPIYCSSRDIGAPKGTGKSRVRGQPAVVWDRLSEGLPAARCLGSIPAWQRCWK